MDWLQNYSKKNKSFNSSKKFKTNTKPKSNLFWELPTRQKMISSKYRHLQVSSETKFTLWILK